MDGELIRLGVADRSHDMALGGADDGARGSKAIYRCMMRSGPDKKSASSKSRSHGPRLLREPFFSTPLSVPPKISPLNASKTWAFNFPAIERDRNNWKVWNLRPSG
jgi:hypothetical protein